MENAQSVDPGMEVLDRIVVWLRSNEGDRHFTEIRKMLMEDGRAVTAPLFLREALRGLCTRRFVVSLGDDLYRLPKRLRAPNAILPSTVMTDRMSSEDATVLMAELRGMGGPAKVSDLTKRLSAKGILSKRSCVQKFLIAAVKRGELRHLYDGRYELATSTPVLKLVPPPTEDQKVVETRPDPSLLAQIERLIAFKRARHVSLTRRGEEYKRLFARLEKMMADDAVTYEKDITELEKLRLSAARDTD